MKVTLHRNFERQLENFPKKLQDKFDERLQLWLDDPSDSRLRIHLLKGKYAGYWSMNVTGDVRALYYYEGDVAVVFALIGTHSSLYG